MFMQMLDVKLGSYLALIPILNHSFVLNDIFAGNISAVNIILVVVSSIVYSLILVWVIIKEYKSEKILFSSN